MARKHFKLSDADADELVRARVAPGTQKAARRPHDNMVLKNRAYYFGKQYFAQDSLTGRLRDVPHRAYYKANIVKGNVGRSVAVVRSAHGEFSCAPTKNTRQARHAAWASSKLFEHICDHTGMDAKRMLASTQAAIDGAVFWKVWWDPTRGQGKRFYWADQTGAKVLGYDPGASVRAALEEEGRYDDQAEGDISVAVVPYFQCFWDWQARDEGLEGCAWFDQGQVVTMDWIEETFGSSKGVAPDEDKSSSLYYHELVSFLSSSMLRDPTTSDPVESDLEAQTTTLHEMWERPSPRNGMLGRYIVWAGGKILVNRDNPYRDTGYAIPFWKQDWDLAPGRFLGLSLVEDLTNPQFQRNRMVSNVIEHVNVFGHPAIIVRKGSGLPTGTYALQPGVVYDTANPQNDINTGPTPTLPKEVIEALSIAKGDMAEISSQAALDATKLPAQIRGAPGLEVILDERNKGLMAPAVNSLLALCQVGRMMLALAKKHYDEDRVVSYIGEDKRFRAMMFARADINTDLRVLLDPSRILASPAAAKARVMEGVQLGIYDTVNNPDDKIAVLKALEFSGADELIADRLLEEENQEREIQEMIDNPTAWIGERVDAFAPAGGGMGAQDPGAAPGAGSEGVEGAGGEVSQGPAPGAMPMHAGYPVNEFDDHRAHARVLLRFLRSEEYRDLDLLTQTVLLHHYRMHQMALQAQMAQQMMMVQATQGAPGQKGKASQPSSGGNETAAA